MKTYHHYLTKLLIPLLVSSFFFVSSCEEDPECIQPQQDLITALTSFNQDTSAVNCEAVKAAALVYIEKSCSDTIPGFEDFKPDTLASLDCATLECLEPAMSLAQYLSSMDDPNSSLDETSYCALFDSAMAVTQILITAACLVDSYLPEGYELPTQTQLDSIITAGCDWSEGFAMGDLVGEWYTVGFCQHEDGQNCSGAMNCQSVEPSLVTGMNFIVNSDGIFSGIDVECECPEDENGNDIEGCDWEVLDEQRPADQTSCEALGGNWSYELDDLGMPEWNSTNPNQFSVTMDESDCECHDENDNYIEGCDQTLVDDVETEAACLTIGGRWDEEINVVEFSYWDTGNSTPDTLAFNFTDYNEAECECEDEDGNYIDGCNWNDAGNAEDQLSCETIGGLWEPEEWVCFTVMNIQQ